MLLKLIIFEKNLGTYRYQNSNENLQGLKSCGIGGLDCVLKKFDAERYQRELEMWMRRLK